MGKLFQEILRKEGIYPKQGGLYILTRSKRKKSQGYKIGMSKNLIRRLDSYHLCFPEGYFLVDILIVKEKYKNKIYNLEAKLHRKLKQFEIRNNVRKAKTEWFLLSEDKVKEEVRKFYDSNKEFFRRHKGRHSWRHIK